MYKKIIFLTILGALDNNHPYCYTNPKENVKLTHRDKVFVLSFNMPNDLCKLFILNKN